MTPAATVAVVGRVTGIMARNKSSPRQIGDCAADIGAAHGEHLLFDRLVNSCAIAGGIAGQFAFDRGGDTRAQRRASPLLLT